MTTTNRDCTTTEQVAQDTISYHWTATGGNPLSGGGLTFTWTAPATSGRYVITLTIDDGNDTNKGDCGGGSRDDPPLVQQWVIWVCSHAHPVNYRKIDAKANFPSVGQLWFKYTWDSSSGNKTDLDHSTIGQWAEFVGQPGTYVPNQGAYWNNIAYGLYYPPNPPYNVGLRSPALAPIPWGSATEDHLEDTHSIPPVAPRPWPATDVIFTGSQKYGFHCDICMAGNPWQYEPLMSGISIVRTMHQVTNIRWRYTIAKSGESATLDFFP